MHFNKEKASATLILILASIAVWSDFHFTRPEPRKVAFVAHAGKVVFEHQSHGSKGKVAIECVVCHHNIQQTTTTPSEMKCRQCHYNIHSHAAKACIDNKPHRRCIGARCTGCHEGEKCGYCHRGAP